MNDTVFDAIGNLLDLWDLKQSPKTFGVQARPAIERLAKLYEEENHIRKRGADRQMAEAIERLTVEERAYISLFGVGYGVNEPLRDCAYAALHSMAVTGQLKTPFQITARVAMPPVRSAEDEAATVNAEAKDCPVCGRLIVSGCRACERKEAV